MRWPAKGRWSLTTIVGAILVFEIALIAVTLLYVEYRQIYSATRSFLVERQRASLAVVAERCMIPLATYAIPDIQKTLSEELAKSPQNTLGLELVDAVGLPQAAAPSHEALASFTKARTLPDYVTVLERPIDIRRWDSSGNERIIKLGKLVGVFSFKTELQAARRRFLATVAGALALSVLGFAGAFLLLRRLVVAPIRHLISFMNADWVARSGPPAQRSDATKEIAELWAAFERMTQALRDSQGQLVQADKLTAVGQLAAGVAHEINNPLGIILGFAQSMAQEPGIPESVGLSVRSIEREALRCKVLVQDLLTFSRSSGGTNEDFNLNEAVTGIMGVVEAQARVNGVEIVKELGELKAVRGDKNRLQQVVLNLCANAIDAMPAYGGRIVVRTRELAEGDGREVVLQVADNGSGIPADIRDKIFNPFFTTKDVGKGTGLGLSLVYEIIQNHRGKIDVASEVGKGSTFTVVLPAER